jgi:hypothetical protein
MPTIAGAEPYSRLGACGLVKIPFYPSSDSIRRLTALASLGGIRNTPDILRSTWTKVETTCAPNSPPQPKQ